MALHRVARVTAGRDQVVDQGQVAKAAQGKAGVQVGIPASFSIES